MTATTDTVDELVHRPRLTARLDRLADPGEAPSVMLVTAPPGFGKSTLLRSWVAQAADGLPVALVESDFDSGPRALWRSLVGAVAKVVDPQVADSLERLAVPDRLGHENFLIELLDTLTSEPLILVLDDLQDVRSPAVLAELDRLVARAPAGLGVVLVSRSAPPLPSLHDLRVRGRLDRLRAQDLAFTRKETELCCPDLTETQQDQVWERTEGWPAMVRLMRLAVQEGLSEADPWDEDDGLAEHLFTEVFSRQDADVQHVLLMSAVADPAPLDLVVRLSGRTDAGAALLAAGRRSGLLAPVGRRDGSTAFHLHPILRAYLHGELLRRDALAEQHAQGIAAEWFCERRETLPAVRAALASGSPGIVDETFATVGLAAVHDGLAEPLVAVLGNRLTRGALSGWAALVGAAALVDAGRLPEAAAAVRLVDTAPGTDRDLAAAAGAVEAVLRRRRGLASPAAGDEQVPEGLSPEVELAVTLHRGAELARTGDIDVAERLLGRAVELAEGLGRAAALVDASVFMASVSAARSDVAVLVERVGYARAVAERTGWIGSARVAYLHMLAGWVAHQRLEDSEARRLAERAGALVDPAHDPTEVASVCSLLTGTAVGAAEADLRWLHEVWQDTEGRRLAPEFVAYTAVSDASASLATGRLDRLRATLVGLEERLGRCAETFLVEAHLRLARGQGAQALAGLEPALRGDAAPVFPLSRVNAHAFAARLALEVDNHYRAVAEMRRALELAEALGSAQALLAGGRPGLELLTQGRGAWGAHEKLVRRLLGYATLPPRRVVVALTDRELDVLRELPSLRTVEEIADDLVVSVNTLKTHLRNVYRKLGVGSRRDAVTEAARAGLL